MEPDPDFLRFFVSHVVSPENPNDSVYQRVQILDYHYYTTEVGKMTERLCLVSKLGKVGKFWERPSPVSPVSEWNNVLFPVHLLQWKVIHLHMGLSKNPDINQMVFPRVIVFSLLSFFQVLASHPHETIHIVFSLWDITLQPPASHLFFGEKLASAKLAASNMSHKQYIMYMYEHRYRYFSSYRFLEWELHIANGGSWHTKRIGAGLLYSPTWLTWTCNSEAIHRALGEYPTYWLGSFNWHNSPPIC